MAVSRYNRHSPARTVRYDIEDALCDTAKIFSRGLARPRLEQPIRSEPDPRTSRGSPFLLTRCSVQDNYETSRYLEDTPLQAQ